MIHPRPPRSLLVRTGWLVGIGIALVWLGMMSLLYWQVEEEADELQYRQLNEAGRLLLTHLGDESQLPGHAAAPLQRNTTLAFSLYDAGGRLLARSHATPLALPTAESGRFFDQHLGDALWRCAVFTDSRRRVVVGQPIALRRHLAGEIATELLAPTALALGLLLPLVLLGLWFGMRPLRRFDAELNARAPHNLAPLPTTLPAEIAPIARRLNDLFARIEETMDREQRFTGDAAHELRTPIAALQVQLEVARTSPRPEARERALGQLQQGIDRIGRLVTQLLALARLDVDAPAALQPIDLPALVTQVLDEAQLPGEVRVHRRADWQAEPDMLALLLRNLFENTLRYGGPAPRVAIDIDGRQLAVRDFGPGAPPDWLAHLGERFVRPPGQTPSGSGLGLSIVRRIATRIGATVRWCNAPEGGFVVTLVLGDTLTARG
jgi:two-component system sensor histidine kinase QseC